MKLLLTLLGVSLFFAQNPPEKNPDLTLRRDGHWLIIEDKIYPMKNDPAALQKRYAQDFPEHSASPPSTEKSPSSQLTSSERSSDFPCTFPSPSP